MMIPFLAALCVLQVPTGPGSGTPPKLTQAVDPQLQQYMPIGARSEFQKTVFAIQDSLEKGDVATSEKLVHFLPKAHLTLGLDESSIPASFRSQVLQARDAAILDWKRVKNLVITPGATGDINIKFGHGLPKGADGLPVESVLTFGESPRLDVLIGLERGVPSQAIIVNDAWMEINHAIGAYLGIADDAMGDNCMYRDNRPGLKAMAPNISDYFVASHNLTISQALITQTETKTKPSVIHGIPHIEITSPKTQLGAIRQGIKVPLDFILKNTGNGPLAYRLEPDCGCFTRTPPGLLQAGGTATIRTILNSAQYIGEVSKLLVLYSNDPTDAAHPIPVSFRATPQYRLYRPDGDSLLLPLPQNKFDILLTLPENSKLVPEQFEKAGMDAEVAMEKWSGNAPDADMGEGSLPRHGYIFHVKVGPNQVAGRTSLTLTVTTSDEENPTIFYTVYAQKGILASPADLFIGSVSQLSRFSFELSRPGKPFSVLGALVASPAVKATINKLSPSDYRIDLILDPSLAQRGDYSTFVKVKTSDPDQPVIAVTIRGSIL